MIARMAQLDNLLQDAIIVAEDSHHDVLPHLIQARTVLQSCQSAGRAVRIEVVSGRVFALGVPVALSRSELALVLALAIRERDVSREIVLEDLYPHLDGRKALNALKVAVHRIRRRIAHDEVIRCEGGSIRLGEMVDVDLPRLNREMTRLRLEPELASAQREHLERTRRRIINGRPAFCLDWPWFEDTERRLNDVARDIAVFLARDALRHEHYEHAIDLAFDLARDDPSDEIAAELAIRAFLLAGNRTAAALEYRRYSSELLREGGQRPSGEIVALLTDS